MNTPNNKRYRDMAENINTAFVSSLQDKDMSDITVTDICKLADIDRRTFYAHYEDVSALANAYTAQIEKRCPSRRIKRTAFLGYLTA